MHACDPERLAGQKLGREVAERRDELRLNQLDLTEEMGLARGDLLGLRVTIIWRPAFQDVRDVDVRALQADATEQVFQQLAGLADEYDIPLVSWEPGASPTNMRSASGFPTPKTTCVLPSARGQRVQPAVSSA